jgi:hypothetical protein
MSLASSCFHSHLHGPLQRSSLPKLYSVVVELRASIISGFGFDKLHQSLSTIAAHHDGRNVKN